MSRHKGQMGPEQHGAWVGLAWVLANGLPGFPPPRIVAPAYHEKPPIDSTFTFNGIGRGCGTAFPESTETDE